MLISVKHQFAVILTPKCASNSIEYAIAPFSDIELRGLPALRHTDFRTYSKYLKPYLDEIVGPRSIETTCLVREPVSWLNSHYRFRTRLEIRDRQSIGQSTYGISFAQFVEAYISPSPPPFAQFRSQFDFVRDDSRRVGVDQIFAYENLDDFLGFIGEKVGKKLIRTYRNISPRRGNERRLGGLLDYAERKIGGSIGWRRQKQDQERGIELPQELLEALRSFIPDDFALYESVRKGDNAEVAKRRVHHPIS